MPGGKSPSKRRRKRHRKGHTVEPGWRRLLDKREVRFAVVGLVALLAVVELWPAPQRVLPLPPLDSAFAWLNWIEEEASEEAVLAFAPFPSGTSATAYADSAHVMYWQMRHRRPMVNGYSSFFPRSFRGLKRAMQGFPDEASLRALARYGVEYVLVRRDLVTGPVAARKPASGPRLRQVFADAAQRIDIYRLEP